MPEHIKCQYRQRCLELAFRYHADDKKTATQEAVIATAEQFYNFILSQEKATSAKAADLS